MKPIIKKLMEASESFADTPRDWIGPCGCGVRLDNDGLVRQQWCKLHAAAPELLAACKAIAESIGTNEIGSGGLLPHKTEMLLAAIAKAEGRAQ